MSTATRPEWSVLTKSVGPDGSAAPTDEQRQSLLASLPGDDKWLQYPPASGRGHAFETRFWLRAPDASRASEVGVARMVEAQAQVGLADWQIVRVHAASLAEREIEYYPGLEGRDLAADDWSVMHRSLRPIDESDLDGATRDRFAASLGADCIVSAPGRMAEFRFWVPGANAVEAAAEADARVQQALATMGRKGWTTVRVQTASAAERRREVYLGVERRLAEGRHG